MEHLALDSRGLQYRPLVVIELVEARDEQRAGSSEEAPSARARLLQRDELLGEERVASCGLDDACRHIRIGRTEPRLDQTPEMSSVASGSSRMTPRQPPRRSRSSGRAMQRSRIGAPDETTATCSMRSSSTSSAHWMSSNTSRSGRSAGDRLDELAECPRQLLGRRRALACEQGEQRLRGDPVDLVQPARSSPERLDYGPVRDARAVREAVTPRDGRVHVAEQLRAESRLADAGRADDGDELAAPFGSYALPRVSELSAARGSRPTKGESKRRAGRSADDRDEPPYRHRSGLAL